MPLRIRWKSDEYFPIALFLLGACGIFQLIYIFAAQYFLSIANYLIVILIPIAITAALFYSSKIILENFAQVERRKRLKSQFKKSKKKETLLAKILEFPISKPLLIVFGIFTGLFIASYAICFLFLENIVTFLIAENVGAIACLLFADYFEKNYAKIRKL